MIPIPVGEIISLIKFVMERAEKVTQNKNKCKNLSARVERIATMLKGMANLANNTRYQQLLESLFDTLQNALKLIETFVGEKSWLRQLFRRIAASSGFLIRKCYLGQGKLWPEIEPVRKQGTENVPVGRGGAKCHR